MNFAIKSAADLEADRQVLLDEADQIARIREGKNGRDLNSSEERRFDELTLDGGLLDQAATAVEQQRRVESVRNANRAAKLGSQAGRSYGPHNDRATVNVVSNRRGGVIQDEKLAHLAGNFFTAAARLPKAEQAIAELHKHGWTEYATMVEGTPSSGGYTIPEPILAEIMRHRDEVGVAMQTARVYPMDSESLRLPDELSRPTVYYPGEAGTITASDASLQQHMLVCKKRAVLVRASSEVLADSASAFGDWLVESSAYALAEKMDSEYILGDGTSTYGGEQGLISTIGSAGVSTAASGNNSLATLEITDWTNCVGKLPGRYHNGASWIMSREVWNGSVLPLMATSGGAGFASLMSGASAGTPGSLSWLGYPVFFSDIMPAAAASTTVALFGAFSRGVAIGDRNDARFDVSTDEKFAEDLVSFRLLHRYDLLVHHPGDASDAGAYVSLKTNS